MPNLRLKHIESMHASSICQTALKYMVAYEHAHIKSMHCVSMLENIQNNNLEKMFEEQLINAIKKHHCIFNNRDSGYRNKIKKEKAWLAVATAVKAPVQQCQGRWKTLRDRFVKEASGKITSGGGAPYFKAKWKYLDAMEFMTDYVAPRSTTTNLMKGEVLWMEDVEDVSLSSAEYWNEQNATQSQSPRTPATDESTCASTSNSAKRRKPDEAHSEFDELLGTINNIVEKCSSTSKNDPFHFAKRRKLDKAHSKFDELLGTINNIVVEKFSSTSKNDSFYKFMESYLVKVDDAAQDRIKIEVMNLVANRVQVELQKNKENN